MSDQMPNCPKCGSSDHVSIGRSRVVFWCSPCREGFGRDESPDELAQLREENELLREDIVDIKATFARLSKERDDAQAKLSYVASIGLRFGMIKTSDKPEPYLAHTWDTDSDHERMFREWSNSIGLEAKIAARNAELNAAKEELADMQSLSRSLSKGWEEELDKEEAKLSASRDLIRRMRELLVTADRYGSYAGKHHENAIAAILKETEWM